MEQLIKEFQFLPRLFGIRDPSYMKIKQLKSWFLMTAWMSRDQAWGTPSRVMAATDSIKYPKSEIEISFLPKSFRDAINITKKSGANYLWIKCLFLVQDDPLD